MDRVKELRETIRQKRKRLAEQTDPAVIRSMLDDIRRLSSELASIQDPLAEQGN